jgi:hypothetical protein
MRGILLGVVARGQEDADRAVGHLGAVGDADAPAHRRVVVRAAERVLLVHVPGAGLGVGVELGVLVVEPADLGQVLVLQPVALVVLVAEPPEELGEGKLDALGLLGVPGGGAQVGTALGRGDRLHLLDADHGLQVVATGLDLRRRRQDCDAAGRAGRLVPACGQAAEGRVHLGEEGAQVALHAVELRGEVAHVGALDLFRGDVARRHPAQHALAHQRREVLALLRPVAGKVRLVATEHVDFGSSSHGFLLRG